LWFVGDKQTNKQTDRITKSTNQYTWKIFDFANNKDRQTNKQTDPNATPSLSARVIKRSPGTLREMSVRYTSLSGWLYTLYGLWNVWFVMFTQITISPGKKKTGKLLILLWAAQACWVASSAEGAAVPLMWCPLLWVKVAVWNLFMVLAIAHLLFAKDTI